MRSFYLNIVFALCSISASLAQGKQHILFRIIDTDSKRAVPYATVRFANSKNGVVANILGDFRIPIKYKKKNDTLILSCIGYSTKRVALNNIIDRDYHIIYLVPKTEQLSEVVVNGNKEKELSAKQIVRKAIENIKINNPVEPFSYIAYYRDYQFVEEEYINLNEGIVEVFDEGFSTHKISDPLNTTALYSYKLNTDFSQDTLLTNSPYNDSKQIRDGKMGSSISNELTLLDIHNPIRNYNTGSFSFVYILEKDFIKNHKLYKKGSIFLDDEELYKIEFIAKKDITGYTYEANGFIYISKDDFSIHRFDYKLYSNSPKKLIFTVDIEYKRKENGKMYLNYITFNNNFFITQNDALKIENWEYSKDRNSFFIEFNRVLDVRSIEKINNVKLFFKDKKLAIRNLYFVSPKMIRVRFQKETSDFLNQQNLEEIALTSIKLKNFRGSRGFTMRESKVEGYQFRELFIQRVFINKTSSSDLLYVKKGKSLKDAPINDFNTKDYWLNSPLKQTKGNN